MTTTMPPIPSALRFADPDRLRRTAKFFLSVSGTLMAGVVVWTLFALLAISPTVTIAQTGSIKDADVLLPLFLVPLALHPLLAAAALETRLRFKQEFDGLNTTIADPRWQGVIHGFQTRSWGVYTSGCAILAGGLGIPFAIGFTLAWHIQLGRLTRLLSVLAEDTVLQRLCAESRHTTWVLLWEVLGLPLILIVLYHSNLAWRFGGCVVVPLMGFVAYTLFVLRRACRRASVVLNQLADERSKGGTL